MAGLVLRLSTSNPTGSSATFGPGYRRAVVMSSYEQVRARANQIGIGVEDDKQTDVLERGEEEPECSVARATKGLGCRPT